MIGYMIIYLAWFVWLEGRRSVIYHSIHTSLDDVIPFTEEFVVPYLLWFGYVAAAVIYFFFKNKEDYYRTCAFLFIGMTICLIIYTIWPTMQRLRPQVIPHTNIFTKAVSLLYATDTSTNICPSIHVYNSIGVHLSIKQSNSLSRNRAISIASAILCVSICLSTVFIKQHSAFDGLCAVVLAGIMYLLVYVPDYKGAYERRLSQKAEKRAFRYLR